MKRTSDETPCSRVCKQADICMIIKQIEYSLLDIFSSFDTSHIFLSLMAHISKLEMRGQLSPLVLWPIT